MAIRECCRAGTWCAQCFQAATNKQQPNSKTITINFYGEIPSQLEPKLRLTATTYAAWVMLAENASIRTLPGGHGEPIFGLLAQYLGSRTPSKTK